METANYYAKKENGQWAIYWKECRQRPLIENLNEQTAKKILENWEEMRK